MQTASVAVEMCCDHHNRDAGHGCKSHARPDVRQFKADIAVHEEYCEDLKYDSNGYYCDPPARSPDLNPAEHLIAWVKLHTWKCLRQLGFGPQTVERDDIINAAVHLVNKVGVPHKILRALADSMAGPRSRYHRVIAARGRHIH